MPDLPCVSALAPADSAAAHSASTDASARVRAVVEAHYDLVWRALRTLGLDDATAEDGAQQVMCVLARRNDAITPGVERSFVLSTAFRVAATLRRTAKRRAEATDEDIDGLVASTPSSEELLDQRRAREVLQRVLDAMPVELRVVFVLFENRGAEHSRDRRGNRDPVRDGRISPAARTRSIRGHRATHAGGRERAGEMSDE